MSVKTAVEKIEEAIESSTMLGAAWDCLSLTAKDRFRAKLEAILEELVGEAAEQ
jgi:hypothetical protein